RRSRGQFAQPSRRVSSSCCPSSRLPFLDRRPSGSEQVLLRCFSDVPRFAFACALATNEDLACLQNLTFPATSDSGVVSQLTRLQASSARLAQAPDFLAGFGLSWRRRRPIRMRFIPVVVTHGRDRNRRRDRQGPVCCTQSGGTAL